MLAKHKINFSLQILATTPVATGSTTPKCRRRPPPPATSGEQNKIRLASKIDSNA